MEIKLKEHGGEWEEVDSFFPDPSRYEYKIFRREKKKEMPELQVGDSIGTTWGIVLIVTMVEVFERNFIRAHDVRGCGCDISLDDIAVVTRAGNKIWEK